MATRHFSGVDPLSLGPDDPLSHVVWHPFPIAHTLHVMGVKTLRDLASRGVLEFLAHRNVGQKSKEFLDLVLKNAGLWWSDLELDGTTPKKSPLQIRLDHAFQRGFKAGVRATCSTISKVSLETLESELFQRLKGISKP